MFVDDLPRNAMGKVQKNVLRETYKGLYVGDLSRTTRVTGRSRRLAGRRNTLRYFA